MATIEDVKAFRPWVLASDYADCLGPDTDDSPGARFLISVRDAVVEAWEDGRGTEEGLDHEIADGAPDVYTHARWAEFVDLGGYQEEPELGKWPADLTETAGVALYQIAYRLVNGLIADLRGGIEDDE